LLVEGAPSALIQNMGADMITLCGTGDVGLVENRLKNLPAITHIVHHVAEETARFQIGVDSGERRLAEIIGIVLASGFHIQQVSVHRPTLGDVFLAYTGDQLRDE
jgi:ABC-2 type transport system ATP-binding protein